jgi:hypothetical protein
MKRALLLVSGLAALCGVLPGCSTVQSVHHWFLKGTVLSYDDYLKLDQTAVPTPTVQTVMNAYGPPKAVHDRGGAIRKVEWHCYSLDGELKTAEFSFDENGKLLTKQLW